MVRKLDDSVMAICMHDYLRLWKEGDWYTHPHPFVVFIRTVMKQFTWSVLVSTRAFPRVDVIENYPLQSFRRIITNYPSKQGRQVRKTDTGCYSN